MGTIRAGHHMLCVDTLVNRVEPRLCNKICREYAPFIMTVERTKAIFYGKLYSLCVLYLMTNTLLKMLRKHAIVVEC